MNAASTSGLKGAGFCTVVGVLLLTGCAEAQRDADLPDLLRDLPEWEISSEPVLTLGGHAADANAVFHFPTSVQWLENGLLLVADQGPRQIRLFDEGDHVRTFGREGEGPGEYRSLRSVGRLAGDTLVVFDPQGQRITWLLPAGQVVRTVPLTEWSSALEALQDQSPGEMMTAIRAYPASDGGVLVEGFSEPLLGGAEIDGGHRFSRIPFVHFDSEGSFTEILGPYRGTEEFEHDGSRTIVSLGDRMLLATWEGELWMTRRHDPEFQRIHPPDGEVAWSVDFPARPISDETWASLIEGRIQGMVPDARERTAERLNAMPRPDRKPALDRFLIGLDGRFWVRQYSPPSAEHSWWWVFEADGTPLAGLRLALDQEIVAARRDQVVIQTIDDLDVEEFRIHDLMF